VVTVRVERLDPDQVLSAAERLVAANGWESLTMAALAADLGVRPPSLYRHVDSLDALRRALRSRMLIELSDAVRGAVMGKSGMEGLHALTDAYRSFAREHSARYLAQGSLPGDEDTRREGRRVGEAGYAVLASFGLAAGELPVATAQLAALVHGFVSLELVQTIDWVADPDAAFHGLIEVFAAGISDQVAGKKASLKLATPKKSGKGARS
jgi:AcrR family transcriptional regulator